MDDLGKQRPSFQRLQAPSVRFGVVAAVPIPQNIALYEVHFAQPSCTERLSDNCDRPIITVLLHYHETDPVRCLRCDHGFTIGRRERHRFLDKDVLPGFRGCDRHLRVESMRRANAHHISITLAEQLAEILKSGGSILLGRSANPFRHDIADADQVCAILRIDDGEVALSYVTARDDRELDYSHKLARPAGARCTNV